MTSTIDWLRTSTPGLLILCGLAIAILLFAIIKVKLEPFIALLLTGLGLALASTFHEVVRRRGRVMHGSACPA